MTEHEFMDLKEVTRRVRLSRPSIYRHVKDRTFPVPVKFGNRSFWVASEVDAYIAARMAERVSP